MRKQYSAISIQWSGKGWRVAGGRSQVAGDKWQVEVGA